MTELELPLATDLRSDLNQIFGDIAENSFSIYLLRGAGGLPETCGFDLDIFVKQEEISQIRRILERQSSQLKSIALLNVGNEKKFKLLLVVRGSSKDPGRERNWLLLDFQSSIPGVDDKLTRRALAEWSSSFDGWPDQIGRLPEVVELSFNLVGALYRNDLSKSQILFSRLKTFPEKRLRDIATLFSDFGLVASQGTGEALVASIQHLIDQKSLARPSRAAEEKSRNYGTVKKRILLILSRKLFFLSFIKPRLYVISGADGVGKTTVCNVVSGLFEDLPLNFSSFHHSKYAKRVAIQKEEKKRSPEQRTIFYLGARSIWRKLVPAELKNRVLGILNEARYLIALNEKVSVGTLMDLVLLTDRYAFDRAIKAEFVGKKNWQKTLFHISSKISKTPRCVFLLVDKPEKVFERKQELSEIDIDSYQKNLIAMMKEYGMNFVRVPVSDRKPEAIGATLFDQMVTDLDLDLFALISAFESKIQEDD